MEELAAAVLARLIHFVETLPDHPASLAGTAPSLTRELVEEMLVPPPEEPGELVRLLTRIDRVAAGDEGELAGTGRFHRPGGNAVDPGQQPHQLARFFRWWNKHLLDQLPCE